MNTDVSTIHWHILGAGSLGCLWAARLAQVKQSVHLILRSAERLQAFPGQVQLTTQHTCQSLALTAELADTSQTPITHLIVSCKAYDALTAIDSIAPRLAENACIILLQNGLGSQQAIIQRYSKQRIIAASTTDGAYLTAPFQVTWAGQGLTQLGDLNHLGQAAPHWLELWQAAGVHNQWNPQIWHALWLKLAVNCAINPLTVLHQCRNGELRQQASQVNALIPELTLLLKQAEVPLQPNQLHQLIWQVIEQTANNTSSMLQDVQQQRPTEAEFITGFACHYARSQQLTVPHLNALHHALIEQLTY